jgi:hypothetical protein
MWLRGKGNSFSFEEGVEQGGRYPLSLNERVRDYLLSLNLNEGWRTSRQCRRIFVRREGLGRFHSKILSGSPETVDFNRHERNQRIIKRPRTQ